jgi:hypothetical protein
MEKTKPSKKTGGRIKTKPDFCKSKAYIIKHKFLGTFQAELIRRDKIDHVLSPTLEMKVKNSFTSKFGVHITAGKEIFVNVGLIDKYWEA